MAVTPDYRTLLEIGVSEVTLTQPAVHIRRDARDISQNRAKGAAKSKNVKLAGQGDAWILAERYAETAQLQNIQLAEYALAESGLNFAAGVEVFNRFRKPTDLPGIGASDQMVPVGIPFMSRRVTAGTSWHASLPTDALPQPPIADDAEQLIPLDRIAEGIISYPENTPFLVFLRLPSWEAVNSNEALFTFYFGGPAPTDPENASGGHYAVTVRGTGEAILWELDTVPGADPETDVPTQRWEERHRMFLTDKAGGGTSFVLRVTPYGRDRIWFRCLDHINPVGSGIVMSLLWTTSTIAHAIRHGITESLYRCDPEKAGHTHRTFSTGPGNVALDHRREPRAEVMIVQGAYQQEGLLVDGPFALPQGLPAGTPMQARLDSYIAAVSATTGPGGGDVDGHEGSAASLAIALYDATTHAPCATDDQGRFLTNAGQTNYYARISYTSTGEVTPVLWGYNVDVEAQYTTNPKVPWITPTWGTEITGPDVEPDHETARVKVVDRYGLFDILRLQDRLRCRIAVRSRANEVTLGYLFEGETQQVVATRRGHDGQNPNWFDYEVPLTGLWSRLREQFFQGDTLDFLRDPSAPLMEGTTEQESIPWKITDALKKLLEEMGVPLDEIDVPDLPLRFWPTEESEDVAVRFGADLLEAALRLGEAYLGRVLLRDPNAGSRGMWRLISFPQPPYENFVAQFYTQQPTPSFRPLMVNRFGPGTAVFLDDTFKTWVKAPEVSHITVIGVKKGTGELIKQSDRVEAAVSSAPPHGLGRIVPFYHGPDPGLTTQEAVDWQWRQIERFAGRAQKCWKGRAALLMIRDNADLQQHPFLLRPLRVNDLVQINGYPAVIRSANPVKEHNSDLLFYSDYEGIFL